MAVTLNANTSTGFIATSDTSGVLQLQTAGTTAVTVDASQNVGIGTASPGYKLDVSGSARVFSASAGATVANFGAGRSGDYAFLQGLGYPSATDGYTIFGFSAFSSLVSSTVQVGVTQFAHEGTGTDNKAYYSISTHNGTTLGERMRIDSLGNVGIGTSSPTNSTNYKTLSLSGTTGGQVAFQTAGTLNSAIYNDATGNLNYSANAAGIFYTAGVERMRINSDGNVGVGGGPFARFSVLVNTTTYGQILYNDSASSPYGFLIQYRNLDPNGTGQQFIDCFGINNLRAQIRSNGGLANYSANNVNLSDRREKTNFAPADDYLAKICAIPVQTFNYIDQNLEEDDGLTLGVVAQDVQAVAPELVMESNWASKDEEPKMRLSIYQTDLQYALMKCIQEQQALITQLQADVAALKGA